MCEYLLLSQGKNFIRDEICAEVIYAEFIYANLTQFAPFIYLENVFSFLPRLCPVNDKPRMRIWKINFAKFRACSLFA